MTKPFIVTFLSDAETPLSLFHKVSQDEPIAFLLESSDGDSRLARYSFIGSSPIKVLSFKNGHASLYDSINGSEESFSFRDPLELLRCYQPSIETMSDFTQLQSMFPFSGGWVGYMGYGATSYFDNISQQEFDPLAVPDGYYALYDSIILFDHLYRQISFISYQEEKKAQRLWNKLKERLSRSSGLPLLYYSSTLPEEEIFDGVSGPFSRDGFCKAVLQAKEFILEGQVFQIVLSHRFSLSALCQPLDIYRALQAVNPSPYSYYLKFPDFTYLGSSPETFVRCHDRKVVLRALAGTRPRGSSDEEDQRLAAELRSNDKELAEHRMLVDLGRNDLGRICEVGTINVGEIATLTRYTHVMHLATELTGILKNEKTSYDVFKSCFPRGTVSGAPKIRAMQLLSKLEPEQRGIYSGVVGYFDNFGNMDGAIAIRSALIKDGQAHVNAGAGIVYDSDPDSEYQETRNKAKSILKAIQIAKRRGSYADSANR